MLSDTQLTIIMSALPPTLVACATLWQAIKIHTLTNSTLSSVRSELAIANEKNTGLEARLAATINVGISDALAKALNKNEELHEYLRVAPSPLKEK